MNAVLSVNLTSYFVCAHFLADARARLSLFFSISSPNPYISPAICFAHSPTIRTHPQQRHQPRM